MEEAVFIAQYTFLATPAVIEEESRILGKIARRLRCEYVIRFEDDGKFYFLLETRSGYEEHFARCGWYVVSQTDFNSRLTIGMGLYESGNLAGFMYRLDSGSEDEARFWNNILVFTFFTSDLVFIGDSTNGRDAGNLGLVEGKSLENGVAYRFTVDVTAGVSSAVLTVEKVER